VFTNKIAILDFIDMGDMIPLTMLCSWQRSMIIRYITNARYLYLGRREDFGTVNAQVFVVALKS
jgi:uncharacterized protein YcgL (UPF0745 family)